MIFIELLVDIISALGSYPVSRDMPVTYLVQNDLNIYRASER
jgi:hypothetical protein